MHRPARRLPPLLLPLLIAAAPALAEPAPLSPAAERGRAVVEKAQCNRCHAITHVGGDRGVPPADRAMHCVDCHRWILGTKGDPAAIARQRADFPDWDRYLENIVHFTRLPDLGTLTRRVHPGFVRRFLDAPFDLRPHLETSMIPLRLTAAEKDDVVAYLAALNGADPGAPLAATPAPPAPRIEAGRAIFVARGCPTCHRVGALPLGAAFDQAFYAAMKKAVPKGDVAAPVLTAPDLRWARERIERATLVRFVEHPQAVDPQSAMPKQALQPGDAEAIADFLLHVPLDTGPAPPARAPDVPLLTRKVTYDEVFDEVLGKICVHCHMHPESNNGDGGAGNTGGLGYAGLQLDLETYAGLKRGLVRDGVRRSVLEPAAAGEPPLLLEALLRRHREASRDQRTLDRLGGALGHGPDASRPGMPLGLPPLDVGQLSLIKTWIAQGAPGPIAPR
jgi:hypothetical protein